MPDNASDTRTSDPFLGLQFWVEIDGILTAGFTECSGLQIETEVFEYAEGGLNSHTHKLPVRTKYGNITLKRGVDPTNDLFNWYMDSLGGIPNKRKDVTINIYAPGVDNPSKPMRAWHLMGAYPVKWTGPDLKADAGAIAIETLEFAHNGLSIKSNKPE